MPKVFTKAWFYGIYLRLRGSNTLLDGVYGTVSGLSVLEQDIRGHFLIT